MTTASAGAANISPLPLPLPAGTARPLAAMHGACFPDDPWDEAALRRILALSGVFGFLGWREDEPAGFVLARDLGGEIEILSLGVMPAGRRRGIGATLLAIVVAEGARRGARSVVLEVAAENGPARRLYAAGGFAQVGRRPRYYRYADRVVDGLILRRATADNAAEPAT